jgi:hypothetical protein
MRNALGLVRLLWTAEKVEHLGCVGACALIVDHNARDYLRVVCVDAPAHEPTNRH